MAMRQIEKRWNRMIPGWLYQLNYIEKNKIKCYTLNPVLGHMKIRRILFFTLIYSWNQCFIVSLEPYTSTLTCWHKNKIKCLTTVCLPRFTMFEFIGIFFFLRIYNNFNKYVLRFTQKSSQFSTRMFSTYVNS